jgi:hypothetical protein
MDAGLDQLETLLRERLRSEPGALVLRPDLKVEPPRRARLILQATNLYCEPRFTQTELANILGMSRSSFRREMVRLWRGYLGNGRKCASCSEPLAPESTRRRRFCSVRCRVAHKRFVDLFTKPDRGLLTNRAGGRDRPVEDEEVELFIALDREIGPWLEEGYSDREIAEELAWPTWLVTRARRKFGELWNSPVRERAGQGGT